MTSDMVSVTNDGRQYLIQKASGGGRVWWDWMTVTDSSATYMTSEFGLTDMTTESGSYTDVESGRIDESNPVGTRHIVGGRDEHWSFDRHQVMQNIVDVVLVNDNRLQLDFAEIHHRQPARVTVTVDSRSDTKTRRRQGNNKVIVQIGHARYGMTNVCSATRWNLPHHSKTSSCV